MSVARRPPSWARLLRLLPAVFAIALATGGVAAASIPDDHAAACKCGMSCRPGACCCAARKPAPRREPQPVAPQPKSDESPDEADATGPSGPCLGAMPCGDDVAAPVKTAESGVGKAWAGSRELRNPSLADRLPPPSSDRPESADASRLDRPPKADPAA